MRRVSILAVLILFAPLAVAQEVRLPSPQEVVGPPRGAPLSGAALDAKVKEVGSLLRCPVCQGLSIYDSPATMAVNMKHQVEELLAQGYDQEQILTYFEASYGEFVRLNPKLEGMNWLVWIAPVAIALGGIWAVVAFLRRAKPAAPEAAPAGGPSAALPPIDPELEPWVLKLRELAYGWPGGIAPDSEGKSS